MKPNNVNVFYYFYGFSLVYFIICDLILLKLEGEVYMVYEQDIRLIKMTEVLKKTGMSKSTVYSLISHGMFPQQVSLGIRSVAFVEAEVDAWIRNKIANRNR